MVKQGIPTAAGGDFTVGRHLDRKIVVGRAIAVADNEDFLVAGERSAKLYRHADDPGIIGRYIVGGNHVEETLCVLAEPPCSE